MNQIQYLFLRNVIENEIFWCVGFFIQIHSALLYLISRRMIIETEDIDLTWESISVEEGEKHYAEVPTLNQQYIIES